MQSTRLLARKTGSILAARGCCSQGWSFEMTDKQREMQSEARKFAREEIIPKEVEHDKSGEFPWDLVKKAWKNNLMNVCIPKEYGCRGVSLFDACIITEELSYACASIETCIDVNSLSHFPVIKRGSEDLKKKYLGRCSEEPICTAFALMEDKAGSNVVDMSSKAEKQGDKYILNGEKMWITNGGVANWYYVLARTNPDPKAPVNKAFTSFVVERDWPGVKVGEKIGTIGMRCADVRGITFENVEIPEKNVVGKEGSGLQITMEAFERTRPLAMSAGIGVAQRCLEDAVKYSKERVVFGKPIGQHQMIQALLADMAAAVESARLVNQRAAWISDQGQSNSYFSSLSKLLVGKAAFNNAVNCLQIYSAHGFSTEFPVEKHLRDAKINSIWEGTEQIHKMLVGRELAKKYT